MVKQTKNYKKGCVSKKALSAILAASMVMTSSSFVMAAPVVEIEDVAVESAVEAVDVVDVDEEAVAAETKNVEIAAIDDLTYNGKAQEPELTVTDKDNGNTLEKGKDYTVEYFNNKDVADANAEESQKPYALVTFIGEDYGSVATKKEPFVIEPISLATANVVYGIEDAFVYNGTAQYPAVQSVSVTVSVNGKDEQLTLSKDDYEVVTDEDADLINVGKAKNVYVQAKGRNFKDKTVAKEYSIQAATLKSGDVTVSADPVAFDKDLTKDDINITTTDVIAKKPLADGTYTVEFYKDGAWGENPDINIGTHPFRIITKDQDDQGNSVGNYVAGGIVEGTYEVVATKSLEMYAKNATVDGFELKDGIYTQGYKGKDLFPASVIINGLEKDKNFKVTTQKTEWKNVGDYKITIEGLNDLAGQKVELPVKIVAKPLNKDATTTAQDITVTLKSGKTHSGNYSAPTVIIEDGNTVLKEGTDYTYTTAKVDDKITKVIITGIGNYTTVYEDGTAKGTTYEQEVKPTEQLDLEDSSISASVKTAFTYTGNQIKPTVKDIVVVENDTTPYTLTASDFYVKGYGDNNKAGKEQGTVTIEGKGSYTGERTIKFDIAGVAFSDIFEIDPSSVKDVERIINNGVAQDVIPSVVANLKVVYKTTGAKYSNYDVKFYADGKEITGTITETGTYTLKVVPKDNQFEGELEATFNVIGESIADAKVSAIADQAYTGKAIEPDVSVKLGNTTLINGKDYTVAYDKNTEVGTAYATIKGIGTYSGQIVTSFKIVGTDISKAVVTAENVAYTGEAQTPEVTVKLGDKTLTADDYTVEYKDNTNVGKATVTVTGKGGFSGKAEGTFEITKAEQKLSIPDFQVKALKGRNTNANEYTLKVSGAVEDLTFTSSNEAIATVTDKGQILFKHKVGEATITVEAKGSDNADAGKVEIAVKVIPATPTVKVAAANNAFKVTASKVKDAGGYQVAYATKSDFSNQTKKAFNTTSKLSKTIKGKDKTKYNVKVRAYKKVNGKYVFGKWSKVQVVKTK